MGSSSSSGLPNLSRTLLDQPLMGVAVAKGATPSVVYANDALASFLGRAARELLALRPGEIFDLVHAEDRARSEERYRWALAGDPDGSRMLLRVLRPDGSVRWLEQACSSIEWRSEPAVQLAFVDVTNQAEAEARRVRSAEWTGHLLQTTRDGFLLGNGSGVILDANRAYCEMSGFTRDELVGSNIREHDVHLTDDELDGRFAQLRADGTGRFVTALRTKSGAVLDAEVTVTMLVHDRQEVAAAFVRNLTAERKASAELEEREARYRVLFEESPVSLWDEDFSALKAHLDALRAGGVADLRDYLESRPDEVRHLASLVRVRAVNRNALKLLGAETPPISMGNLTVAFTHDTFDVFREEVLALWEGKLRFEAKPTFRTINGDRLHAELAVVVAPGHEGDWSRVLVSMSDVTARERAQRALRESEERFRLVVEGSRDAIYLQRGRRFEMVNRAFLDLFELSREDLEAPGFDVLSVVAPQSREALERRLTGIERGEDAEPVFRFTGLTGDGTELALEASVTLIHDAKGIATQGILRDVTEREKLEAQLRQAARMEALGQLAGGVAHDFNNLLTAINGFTELALQDLIADHPIHESLLQVRDAGRRGEELTRQILAFSRRQVLSPEVLDPNRLVADLERLVLRVIGEDVAWVFEPGEVGAVRADRGQIEQVLLNFSVNARDAMPNGGTLTVRTQPVSLTRDEASVTPEAKPGDFVRISVADTGAGIEPELLDRVFEPFFTTKGAGKGTGLGLATVYGIVRQSGGHVTVESQPGEGTVFHVLLPVAHARIESGPPQQDEAEAAPRGSDELILVAEDDAAVRSLIVATLEGLGYRVLEEPDGRRALEVLQDVERAPDLLVADLVMPEMGGIDLSHAARERGVEVLFITGYAAEARNAARLPSGADVLRKPFTPAELAVKVRLCLDREPTRAASAENRASAPGRARRTLRRRSVADHRPG